MGRRRRTRSNAPKEPIVRITRRAAALTMGPVLIGALAVAGAPGAAAEPVITCVGMITDRAVDADLRVPANGTCVLEDVEVDGDVEVEAGASLVVTGSTINDGVVVGVDAFFDATGTVIGRNLVSNGAYGMYLDEVLLGGHYIGRTGDVDSSFLYSKDSKVAGRMEAMQGEVHLDGTIVGRFLNTEGTDYTDIIDSTIVRELTVTRSGVGAAICGSEIGGDTTLLHNAGAQVGAGSSGSGCTGRNYFAGNLAISGSSGNTDVSGNNVRGDLKGGDNAPEPTGADNRVGGEELDDFSELAPQSVPAEAEPHSDSAQHRSPEQLLADREDRRDSAVQLGAEIEESRTNAGGDQEAPDQDDGADDDADTGSDGADDEDGDDENDADRDDGEDEDGERD